MKVCKQAKESQWANRELLFVQIFVKLWSDIRMPNYNYADAEQSVLEFRTSFFFFFFLHGSRKL